MAKSSKRNKLGSIRQRRNGVWEIRKQVADNVIYDTVYGTKADAQAALYVLNKQLGSLPVEAQNMTIKVFAESWWLEGLMRQGRANVTIKGYKDTLRNHVLPRWGKVALFDVHEAEVRQWVWNFKSAQVARRSFKLLKQILRAAYDYGFLDTEPLTRKIPLPQAPRKPIEVWEAHEVARALEKLSESPLLPLFCLMAGGGLRLEEALAIHWENIETYVLDSGQFMCSVLVDKAYTDHDGYKQTKTTQSTRRVAIAEPFATSLLKSMPRQGPALAWSTGNNQGTAKASYRWRLAFKSDGCLYGMRYIPISHLRHTHATLMLASGTDPITTAKAHGHSTQVAYTHYIAPTDSVMQNAALKVGLNVSANTTTEHTTKPQLSLIDGKTAGQVESTVHRH